MYGRQVPIMCQAPLAPRIALAPITVMGEEID